MRRIDLQKITIGENGEVFFETGEEQLYLPAEAGIACINFILSGLTEMRERVDGTFIATAPSDIELVRLGGRTGPPKHFLRILEGDRTLIRLALDDRLLQKLADGSREALEARNSGSRH